MSESVVITGATSAIGRALAAEAVHAGHAVVLAARDVDEAERVAADLRIRLGAKAQAVEFDAERDGRDAAWFERLLKLVDGSLCGVVICHGVMFEEADLRADPALAARQLEINFGSSAALLEYAATHLEERKRGFIIGVTSVAGVRGRASNYVYGAGKAALSTALAGLRVRCASSGVRVMDVRPGFVDTSMTWGRPGLFLVASPERIARDTFRSLRRDRAVVYTPAFWWLIMTIIRHIPDRIFKRLSL